ncbi:SPOR domain-containing protein [Winogradskyella sp. A3E31]|uniref:SPOR domain-containing protein n=1 Tax=Winogradskyella sp. A3E31 TaxID=3349637 RepID=UPI00398AE4DD
MKILKYKIFIFSALLAFSSSSFSQNAETKVIQDKSIDKLLEYKQDINTNIIYKIQIFSGERAPAERIMSEFRSVYGDIPSSMEFNTPNYKIWVGNFRDRLEADRALVRIKKNYISAFIFQPKTK